MDDVVYLANISRNVNQIQLPIGLGVLLNSLKLHGLESKLIDLLPVDIQERERYFKDNLSDNAAIYGFSITMGNNHLQEVEKYAQIVKLANKDNVVVYGGPLPSATPKLVLENCICDYIITGEGEFSFPKLINALSDKNESLDNIPGLYYRYNKQVFGKPNKMIKKLGKFSNADYVQFDMNFYISYLMETDQSFEIMASRGCAYDCIFCFKLCDKGVSVRESKDVLDEIEFIMDNYKISKFYFVDENFFALRKFFNEFIKQKQERNLDFNFIVQTRIDALDYERCRLGKDNGLIGVSFAIESASQKTLDRMDKRLRLEIAERNLQILRELDIGLSTEFIIGFPWERVEDFENLKSFIEKNQLQGQSKLSYLTPLPGTRLYNEVLAQGLIKDEYEYLLSLNDLYWERVINLTSLPDDVLDSYYDEISEIGRRKVVYPKSTRYLRQIREIH